jgi:hypothetical protein
MSDDKLLTKFQIQSLLVQERYYRDTLQWEKLRQCWHPDPTQTNIKISWYGSSLFISQRDSHCQILSDDVKQVQWRY